jgi:hypothetical protein
VEVVVMAIDMQAFELALLDLDAEAAGVSAEAEAWLHDPARTAHRLVSLPTAVLMAQAVSGQGAAPVEVPALPGGLWRILPDRLLALRPRRGDALERLRITPAEHLAFTGAVLERWGWAHTGGRIRTRGGRRCILGAQTVVYRLGYGTEHTAAEAGRLMDGVLASRGETRPYHEWNESPRVTREDALALVREAAKGA